MKKLALGVWLLMVMCGCGGGGMQPPPPTSNITVSISPSPQVAIDQGQAVNFTATLQNDTSGQGVTWAVSGPGCTGRACGTLTHVTSMGVIYNAPALVSNPSNVSVTATSNADGTKSASSTVVLNPPPVISTTTLPSATPANYTPAPNYTQTLQATGGAGTLTWTLASGSLPGGLHMNAGGLITGTPTSTSPTAVVSNFTVRVTDQSQAIGGPLSAQQALSITVVGVLTITTTSSSLPIGTLGSAYSAPVLSVGGTPPINWQILKTGSSLPAGLSLQGSISSNAAFISGTPTQTANSPIQIQAVDSSTPRQTSQIQTLTLVINTAPLIVTSTSLPNAVAGIPYTAQLTASGGTPPYIWGGSGEPSWLTLILASGRILAAPGARDVGTTQFQATVTDSMGASASATVRVTVNNPAAACTDTGNEGVLNGQYAFSLSGYTDRGFLSVVGSFTADGKGNIVAGEADTNGILGAQQGELFATTVTSNQASSFYRVGYNNLGCATIATTFGTFVTRFALAPTTNGIAAPHGRIISWDAPTSSAFLGTGVILQQDTSSFLNGLNGAYVFHASGWDPSQAGARIACVGYLNASKFIVSGSEQDCNEAGATSHPETGATVPPGSYTVFDLNGRGTAIVSMVSSSGATTTSNFTLYMVSSSDLLLVNSDGYPALSGEMVAQNVPTGGVGFGATSLNGNTVFYLTGGSSSGTNVSLDLASFDSNVNSMVTSYLDSMGAWTGGTPPLAPFACTYSVEPIGRVTLGNCAANGANYASFYLYMTDLNSGFLLDTLSGADIGSLLPQSVGALSGTFTTGLAEVVSQGIGTLSAGLSSISSGSASQIRDETSTSSQTPDRSFTDTYTVNPDGTFTATSSTSPFVGVVVNNHKVWMLDPASLNTAFPVLLLVEQ